MNKFNSTKELISTIKGYDEAREIFKVAKKQKLDLEKMAQLISIKFNISTYLARRCAQQAFDDAKKAKPASEWFINGKFNKEVL